MKETPAVPLREATRQWRIIASYNAVNAVSWACFYTPLFEFILVEVCGGDLLWASQLHTINVLVTQITRVLIGAPLMGSLADSLGRRRALLLGILAKMLNMTVFIIFPSVAVLIVGNFLQSVFVETPVDTAYVQDISRVFARAAVAVSPEEGESQGRASTTKRESERDVFAKKSGVMIGLYTATFTGSFALGTLTSSALSYKADDVTGGLNATVNSTVAGECDDDFVASSDTAHLMPSIYFSIAGFGLALCLASQVGTLTGGTREEGVGAGTQSKRSMNPVAGAVAAISFVVQTPWTRMLSIILFLMKLIEGGALAVFFYYGKFQFDWSTSTFGVFMVVLVCANAFGNTVMAYTFAKYMEDRWTTVYICALGTIAQFLVYAFATDATVFMVGALLNIFNFLFAVLKGLLFACFEQDEYGRVAGGQEVLVSLGNIIGPALTTAVFNIGVASTDIPECGSAVDQHYLSAAAPWFLCAGLVMIPVSMIETLRRIDPNKQ